MFVKFIIAFLIMTAVGVENEGGREAVEEKGPKAAIETAIKLREDVIYSNLNE